MIRICPCSGVHMVISEEPDIIKNAEFETGVCKIQKGMAEMMTAHEKVACEKLLLETDGDLSDT